MVRRLSVLFTVPRQPSRGSPDQGGERPLESAPREAKHTIRYGDPGTRARTSVDGDIPRPQTGAVSTPNDNAAHSVLIGRGDVGHGGDGGVERFNQCLQLGGTAERRWRLVRIVPAVELLGARLVVTGIRPAVAQTVVSVGMELDTMVTLRNLQEDLKVCMGAGAAPRPSAA
jgi:hypothetical protein